MSLKYYRIFLDSKAQDIAIGLYFKTSEIFILCYVLEVYSYIKSIYNNE